MKTFKNLIIVALAVILPGVISVGTAFALDPDSKCTGSSTINTDPSKGAVTEPVERQCDPALNNQNCANVSKCDIIQNFLQPAVNFLGAFFGVAAVISMIYGGIEYSSSGGDPQKASAGKNRIRNSIFALLVFIFLWALLRFAVLPGQIGSMTLGGIL